MTTDATPQHLAIEFTLNGNRVDADVAPQTAAIDLLRDTFSLKGTKRSCDMQVCGACTILVDGAPISSCTVPAFELRGRIVTTIEGLATDGTPHPLQESFVQNASLQCGFCTPGMLLTAKSLLDANPHPTEAEILDHMQGNLCRCTGYKKILEAIVEVARASV